MPTSCTIRSCFATALAEMERRELDFLSLFPRMECVSLWENIILPTLVGGMAMFATPGIEDPDSPDALAAGAFLWCVRECSAWWAGSSRSSTRCSTTSRWRGCSSAIGYRVGFRAAPEFLSVRLYKGNRHAFWGMTKNILEGLAGRFWLAPAVMLLPVLVFWTPIYCAAAAGLEGDRLLFVVAAATYALQYALIWSARPLSSSAPPRPCFSRWLRSPILFAW